MLAWMAALRRAGRCGKRLCCGFLQRRPSDVFSRPRPPPSRAVTEGGGKI